MINKKLVAVALAGVLGTGLTHAASLQWVTIGPFPVPVILPGHVRLPVIVPPVIVPQVVVGHQAPVPVIYAPAYRRGYGDRDGDGIPNWRDRDDRHDHHDWHDRHDRHDHHDGRRRHH